MHVFTLLFWEVKAVLIRCLWSREILDKGYWGHFSNSLVSQSWPSSQNFSLNQVFDVRETLGSHISRIFRCVYIMIYHMEFDCFNISLLRLSTSSSLYLTNLDFTLGSLVISQFKITWASTMMFINWTEYYCRLPILLVNV